MKEKYYRLIEKSKDLNELQKAWSKCLNNNDGLDQWDIADLRSSHDIKRRSLVNKQVVTE